MTNGFPRIPAFSLAAALALALSVGVTGCGGSDGPQRFKLSGTVTYKGAPLARGDIALSPDNEKQNSGPGSFCTIENGQFTTAPGAGVVGGPYVLIINGYDADPDAKPLFTDHRVELDLPRSDSVQNIDIP